MTISTEVRKAGPFIGNGSASVFPFAFKVFKAADLIVVRRQGNIGEETTLILDSDYHVTLNSNQDTTPGGVVTLVAGALASGFTLIVSSELPYLQPTDLTNQGGFYPKVITNALDRLTIFCQQLAEITGRTLKLPITAPANISTEIPLPNPAELIAWNETGTGLTTVSPQSLVTSIAYGSATADLFAGDGVTTTFPLSTNPASVNNLDVSVGGFSQRPVQGGVGDYSWNGGALITFVTPPPAPTVPGDKNVLVRYMQAIPVSDSEALHAQTREALRRSYAEAGYNLVDGSFETGGTLTAEEEVLLQESTGAVYAWTGALPKNVAPGFDPVGVVGFELRTDVLLHGQLEGGGGASIIGTSAGITVQDTINDIYGSVVYLDSYEHLAASGDWTIALQAALDTGRPVMPNPARTYSISGVIQAKGSPILGAFKINPTRSAISSLGAFVFDPDKSKSEVKNNIKLLYCLRVYDLVELMYIRSMGFNMVFHGGDMTSERPGVDTITALGLMLDNARTANLQVNMTTGHLINEDSMAIGYVNAFKDHPAVWGFSVFDEPTFNGADVARQSERLAALRPLTGKNLNVTDVIQNYAQFRNGYNPWARGYDTFFVDAYSHTIAGTEAENIAADLRDMRTAVGVAATHLPDANIVPMCGLFKHTGFSVNINQIKGTAPILAKCAGGDFAAFTWDAVEAGLTSNIRTGSDLRAVAKSLCTMSVNGERIPVAYPIGGSSSNPDSRPPVSAALGVDLLKKRDYATAFLGSGTALGILKNGADGEFTSPLLSAGASIGALFFRGAFPVAITNIETKKNISMPLTFFDVTGAKSGSLTVHYSADGGGTVSAAALAYPFNFSGAPSVSLNFDILTGDFWRGYKLAFAQSVNAPIDADNYRCGLHGFIVISEW